MNLGDLIKKYREAHNMSLREFAQLSGISHTYVSALEKNEDPRTHKPIAPTLDTIRQVGRVLNKSVDEIIRMLDDEQLIKLNSSTFDTNFLKIGLDMKNYTPPTEEQKKQIEDFARFVLKDNKKE